MEERESKFVKLLWYPSMGKKIKKRDTGRFSEMFCEKSILKNFTGKHLCQSFFFNKVAVVFFL